MWFKWFLIVLFALNPLMSIWQIGEERKPVSKFDAGVTLVANALLVIGLLAYWR